MTSDEADARPLFDESLRTFPWSWAAIAAVATFVVEYLVVAAIFVVGPSSVDRSAPPIGSTIDVFVQYAHVLFNAHHVPMILRADVTVAGNPLSNDLYAPVGASVPPIVFFLIPVVGLLVAGAAFERRRLPDRVDPSRIREGLLVGTGFTLGYVAVALVGSLLAVQTWSLVTDGEVVGTASEGPLLWFALVAFFLFPLVFVSVGATLAYTRPTDRDPTDESRTDERVRVDEEDGEPTPVISRVGGDQS